MCGYTLIIYAEVVESPSDVTVFLHQTAEFTCEIHGAFSYQYWRVNGTDYNSLSSEIRDDVVITQATVGDIEAFILTIPGRVEYNGTRVQCVVGGGGGETESEIATLNIQGTYYSEPIDVYTLYMMYIHADMFVPFKLYHSICRQRHNIQTTGVYFSHKITNNSS